MSESFRNAFGGRVSAPSFPNGINPFQHHSPVNERERQAFIQWIIEHFQMEIAQQRLFAGTFLFVEGVNREQGEQAYRHFIRTLDRRIYGKASERHSDRRPFKHVAMMEGGGITGRQVHYHSLFVNPIDRDYSEEQFKRLLQSEWSQLRLAMKNPDIAARIERVYDLEGWVSYQCKFHTKDRSEGASLLEMVDITTLRI